MFKINSQNNDKNLKIRLKGIAQQWSKEGWKENVLKTEPIPTKKGVVEMCASVLGIRPWGGHQSEQEIEQLNEQIKVFYSPEESVEGKICKDTFYETDDYDGAAIEYTHELIMNADFVLYISAAPELLEKLHTAFMHPVYIPRLGGNDCLPSCRISEGIVCTDVDQHLIEIQE